MGSAALFVIMASTAHVAGRYLFNKPILGAFELTEFLVLILIFSLLAHTQTHKSLVAADLLLDRLPKKLQSAISIFNHAAGLFLIVLFIWMTLSRGFELKQFAEASFNLSLPIYTLAFFVVIGEIYSGFRMPTEAAGIGVSVATIFYDRCRDGDFRDHDISGYCYLPAESHVIRSNGWTNTLKRRKIP